MKIDDAFVQLGQDTVPEPVITSQSLNASATGYIIEKLAASPGESEQAIVQSGQDTVTSSETSVMATATLLSSFKVVTTVDVAGTNFACMSPSVQAALVPNIRTLILYDILNQNMSVSADKGDIDFITRGEHITD